MLRFHLQYYANNRHSTPHRLSDFIVLASSRTLFKTKPLPIPSIPTSSFSLQTHKLFHGRRFLFSNNSSKPTSNFGPFSLANSGISYAARPSVQPPVSLERSTLPSRRSSLLIKKLKELGFKGHEYMPGQYNNLLCPVCKGGDSGENSLALHIREDWNNVAWTCFHGKCGWQGFMAFSNAWSSHGKLNQTVKANSRELTEKNPELVPLCDDAFANAPSSYGKLNQTLKAKKRELTEKKLELEPLCDELIAYFAERMISAETLRRNHVMQRSCGGQIVIAFPYKRNGALVCCKYRAVFKRFWQEANTEKIFYGLDDIKNSSDIIIVEGEIDKLAMEEAGFRNCVSVPDGAPPRISPKGVPAPDQDKKYWYLWNCKEYFEKASRIILATDGDLPGQALAEELAQRLGRERCWRVKWPKKNEVESFKDANEVLMVLGPGLLKQTIENAELYPIHG